MSPRNSGGRRIATAALAIAGIGTGIWRGFVRPRGANSANQHQASSARTVLPLKSFTVNSADPEEKRFLRATLAPGAEGKPGNAEAAGSKTAPFPNRITSLAPAHRPDLRLCEMPSARFLLRRLLEPFLPRIVVLAPAEIPPGVTVQSLGVIR